METEIFPTKSYTEIKQGLPASTLKAVGGSYGGGSENYIVETKIYENHRRDARYGENGNRSNIDGANGNWRRECAAENRKRRVSVSRDRNVKK